MPAKFTDQDVETLQIAATFKVLDGDTVVLRIDGHHVKVRLDSIDCPEDGQEWGDIAKFALIKLIGGKTIYCEPHGLDHHQRTLATLYVRNNNNEWVNVNERMVLLGHAWVMRLYYSHLSSDRKSSLNQKERWAKSKKIGLLQAENPIPPWKWRQA